VGLGRRAPAPKCRLLQPHGCSVWPSVTMGEESRPTHGTRGIAFNTLRFDRELRPYLGSLSLGLLAPIGKMCHHVYTMSINRG